MARTDKTLWEPGCIVLSDDDIRGKNPYTGKRLTSKAVFELLGAIGVVCWQADSYITTVKEQSKHY